MKIAGLVLAGGLSQRMGRDKATLPLGGQLMIARVLDRLGPQLGPPAINANGDPGRLAEFGLPVLADDVPGTGPLGGVLAGLLWAEELVPNVDALVTTPVDSPFIPKDLVGRLASASQGGQNVVIASSGERDHPVVALWPRGLAARLAAWREVAQSHGVRAFLATVGYTVVDFPASPSAPDPFLNLNTPADLAEAERWLADHPQL